MHRKACNHQKRLSKLSTNVPTVLHQPTCLYNAQICRRSATGVSPAAAGRMYNDVRDGRGICPMHFGRGMEDGGMTKPALVIRVIGVGGIVYGRG